MFADYQSDMEAVNRIAAVPSILDVVCRTTGMGFAAVARVTEDRWIACSVKDDIQFGLEPGGELKVDTTICHEIRRNREPVVINNASEDQDYGSHATPVLYGFQSYISVPIILPDGRFFGTLCAIDPKPARLNNPETIGMFKLFAELIGYHLAADQREVASATNLREAQGQLASSVANLAEERSIAALREEFVAILGHDLRNPLTAIQSGITLVQRTPINGRATLVLGMMQQSATRMTELVGNMLDFARGRLGGGMGLDRIDAAPLEETLKQVVAELQVSWSDCTIETRFAFAQPVNCDPARIGQLCSNLLSNALTHGLQTAPIRAEAISGNGTFELSIINGGTPIPEVAIPHLFKPFSRGKIRPNQQGLGLGLHIAAEIARAHGGEIFVASTAEETRFTFRMPTLLCDQPDQSSQADLP